MRIFVLLFLLYSTIFANNNIELLAKKGSKVATIFCNAKELPQNPSTLEDAIAKIKSNNACKDLDDKKIEWVAYYLLDKKSLNSAESLVVPKDAKCPVCGMFVGKYPKWAAQMVINGKQYYFDGVKDMMKYYFFDGDFKYDRAKIEKILVTNYYTLKTIEAKKAYYVYDSKIYGPMGRELIAFTSKKEAESFIGDHGGKLMQFSDITPKNVMALDGVEFESY